MLTVIWRVRALEQLDAIANYVGERNAAAADSLVDRIEAVAERLGEFPYMYRRGRVEGTREAIAHPNYLIVYRVKTEIVEIVSVHHTGRQYP